MKSYLCDYHSQTPILAAMQLHQQCRVDEIAHVHIQTYWFAWNEVASEKEKWHPSNRETADHSMPWIVAGVLTDGLFSEQIFESHRLVDADLHALAEKISIDVSDGLTQQFPDRMPCIMTITTHQGKKFEVQVDMPHGHFLHPLQVGDIDNKFKSLTRHHYKPEQADRILSLIWHMDLNQPIDQILKEVVIL
jgi:2-methylcitrate dehydratase